MGSEGDAFYVEPASSAFSSQQEFISELEHQMQNLGLSTLFSQKMGAETAESKSISRADSDSLLAVVSKDLQASLQESFRIAGLYAGIEPPTIQVNRDFDLQVLDSAQITQYLSLWQNGAIQHSTLLDMLRAGEVLPHIDIEGEIESIEQERLGGIAGLTTQEDEEEDEQEAESSTDA